MYFHFNNLVTYLIEYYNLMQERQQSVLLIVQEELII